MKARCDMQEMCIRGRGGDGGGLGNVLLKELRFFFMIVIGQHQQSLRAMDRLEIVPFFWGVL